MGHRNNVYVNLKNSLGDNLVDPHSAEVFILNQLLVLKSSIFSAIYLQSIKQKVFNTVVRTNKGRTNKGQITFFRKIYWGLIRDKYLEKFPTKHNFADFVFWLAIFGAKVYTDILVWRIRHRNTLLCLFGPDFIYSFRK